MKILDRTPSNTLAHTELLTVQPDRLDRVFRLTVTRPVGAAPSGGWHGVVATDGNFCAGTLAQATAFMAMSAQMPAAVVVTIGYPLDAPVPAIVARNRDLTPTAWPEWDAPYGELLGSPAPPSGDADGFSAFLHDELLPAMEAEAGVDPNQWTLAGHSLGGLFATHALLTRPGRCRRYLAVGSSFWWHRPSLFEQAREFAQQARPMPVSVYLAAGDAETTAAATESWHVLMQSEPWKRYLEVMRGVPDIVADTREMAALLARRCGVRMRCDILDGETHASAPFAAFSRGLRWLHAV